MKLGINLLCMTDLVEDKHLGSVERLRDIGYDGVEIPVLRGDVGHYGKLGKTLDSIGIGRSTTSIVPSPEANPLSTDPEIRVRGVAHLDWALDCAIALGAESMGGPFHAPIGWFSGSGPSQDELKYGAEAHHALAERAAANGIYLSLEHLNRFETYFLNTMEQARAYVDRVDHPAFKIMYDTFHANIEERDPKAAIALIGKDIGVFHVSENDRGIPGRGQIDFAEMLGALKQTGYDGWLTLEAFGAGLPAIAAATRVWRPLFPDIETLFVESADFIRRTWATA
jgi:D-psicose/D-tagatose/L-ribulose 3-epimerase